MKQANRKTKSLCYCNSDLSLMLTWFLNPVLVVALIQNAAFILAHSVEDAAGVVRRNQVLS